jgi:hypothetical protein
MIDEAVLEFVQHVISYSQAKDKKTIVQWESYCDRLLQHCHQGFEISSSVLTSLKSGHYAGIIPPLLASDVYLITSQVLKTICQKKPLSPRYELQLIHIINELSSALSTSVHLHHPVLTQLTLALASLGIHLIYHKISSSLLASYSTLFLSELQLFLREKLSLIHSESVKYLLLQYLSEFFGSKDMKFWVSYKGKEKTEIIKNLQISIAESSSVFFNSLLDNIASDNTIANHNEMLKIFVIGNEWIKHMNEMEVFSYHTDRASNNGASTLSLEMILSTLRFWMKTSLLDFSFFLCEHYLYSALSVTAAAISDEQNQLVDMAYEFLINIFEFYSHLLKNISLFQQSFSSDQAPETTEIVCEVGEYFVVVSPLFLSVCWLNFSPLSVCFSHFCTFLSLYFRSLYRSLARFLPYFYLSLSIVRLRQHNMFYRLWKLFFVQFLISRIH